MADSQKKEQNETEDPNFKRVVGHFLDTPPQPRTKKSSVKANQEEEEIGGRHQRSSKRQSISAATLIDTLKA